MSTVVKENQILASIPETARPQPVALEVSVTVNGARTIAGSDKREPFSESTKTVLIFGHGAVVRLTSSVAPGQLLFLTNEKTKKEVVCQVVKSKNYHNVSGYVELEFTEPVAGILGHAFSGQWRAAIFAALNCSSATGCGSEAGFSTATAAHGAEGSRQFAGDRVSAGSFQPSSFQQSGPARCKIRGANFAQHPGARSHHAIRFIQPASGAGAAQRARDGIDSGKCDILHSLHRFGHFRKREGLQGSRNFQDKACCCRRAHYLHKSSSRVFKIHSGFRRSQNAVMARAAGAQRCRFFRRG